MTRRCEDEYEIDWSSDEDEHYEKYTRNHSINKFSSKGKGIKKRTWLVLYHYNWCYIVWLEVDILLFIQYCILWIYKSFHVILIGTFLWNVWMYNVWLSKFVIAFECDFSKYIQVISINDTIFFFNCPKVMKTLQGLFLTMSSPKS